MKICEICGIRYPILAGPMRGVSVSPLVEAVSNAGGLGCLATAGIKDRSYFKEQISKIRQNTNAPFAVNIAWTMPDSDKALEWCIEEHIDIFILSAGLPEDKLKRLRKSGSRIFQVIASVSQARKAETLGVDGVIAKDWESGGINASNAVAGFPLIPQVVDAVSIPVVAAGGIADGRGLAAAFALGAEGVLLGTRLLATVECPMHVCYKEHLIAASDTDTRAHDFSRFSARLLRSKREESLKPDDDIWNVLRPLDQKCAIDDTILAAGQVAGLIKDIVPVKKVIEDMIQQYKDTISRLHGGSFC